MARPSATPSHDTSVQERDGLTLSQRFEIFPFIAPRYRQIAHVLFETDARILIRYRSGIVSSLPRKAGQPVRITTLDDVELFLRCPSCDTVLDYVHTTEGGVKPIEHWDRFSCARCHHDDEYRRRTHALRPVD